MHTPDQGFHAPQAVNHPDNIVRSVVFRFKVGIRIHIVSGVEYDARIISR